MRSNAKVSVVMPARNAEKYITAAINSILNQSLHELELIVIDDGSTDNTLERIKSFGDPRLKYFSSQSSGISQALNFGIFNSCSNIICRMDADDIALLDRVRYQYNILIDTHSDLVASS